MIAPPITLGSLSESVIVECYRLDGKHSETARLIFGEDVATMPKSLKAACEKARAEFLRGGERL